MSKKWQNVTDDEMLNYEGSNTALLERYNRILKHTELIALDNVRAGLDSHKKVVKIYSKLVAAKIDDANNQQSRSQKVGWFLTTVIAISTVFYTIVTWQSVQVQREANSIQRDLIHQDNRESGESHDGTNL